MYFNCFLFIKNITTKKKKFFFLKLKHASDVRSSAHGFLVEKKKNKRKMITKQYQQQLQQPEKEEEFLCISPKSKLHCCFCLSHNQTSKRVQQIIPGLNNTNLKHKNSKTKCHQ